MIVNHESDLTVYTPYDGPFFIGGLKLSDKSVVKVEKAPRHTWGDDINKWLGNWLTNGDTYMTTLTEDSADKTLRFDLKPTENYGALVGFTAPANGVFRVKAELRKVWGGTVKVTLMKNDGTELWSKNIENNNATATVDVKDVSLKKGEQLLVVVTTVSGGSGTGFRYFNVEGIYETCPHSYKDNVCDYCKDDCTVEKAEENLNNALNNRFNGGSADVDAVGPDISLDDYKVVKPIESVTGLEYKHFNLRIENGEVILRHHFVIEGDADLYTVTVNSEKVTLVSGGNSTYYFETKGEMGKLHIADTITAQKGKESVDFKVSVYSYIDIALEKLKDEKDIAVMKALYDLNEATRLEADKDAILSVTVDSSKVEKNENSRPYDAMKDDISLILVIGQSNFTTRAGYAWEYNHYNQGKNPFFPESPIVPKAGAAYSFTTGATSFILNGSSDMSYLSSPDRQSGIVGGVTPAFATKWNELTGTKVVFIQAAVESTGMHEWTPFTGKYTCNCGDYGGGVCYQNAVKAYMTAYNELAKNYNIVHTGYIWNQGEHDEGNRANATVCDDQSYYDAYKSMHDSLMNTLDLDFGGISVVRANSAGDTAEASTSYTKARYAQYKLCNDIDDLYMLSTVSETCSRDMMDQGNTIHYSQSVFNTMGTDMANNLYSRLGLGETNEYDGVKIHNASGNLITHIDANGKLAVGNGIITDDRVLIKTSALGRDDVVSYKIIVDGVDYSQYINGFGEIDWAGLQKATGKTQLKVVVNVR